MLVSRYYNKSDKYRQARDTTHEAREENIFRVRFRRAHHDSSNNNPGTEGCVGKEGQEVTSVLFDNKRERMTTHRIVEEMAYDHWCKLDSLRKAKRRERERQRNR